MTNTNLQRCNCHSVIIFKHIIIHRFILFAASILRRPIFDMDVEMYYYIQR